MTFISVGKGVFMDKIKAYLELLDLAVKVVLAVLAFLFFGVQKDQLDIQQKQVDLQKAQFSLQQSQQTQTLAVAEKIIQLLFEEKNKCIAEDQAFLIDFLIDTHNAYNRVQINKNDFIRASSGRRACTSGPVSADAKAATEKNDGKLPLVDKDNASKVLGNAATTQATGRSAAFVSIGSFDAAAKSFRNFKVPPGATTPEGGIAAGTVVQARWSVYLRTNTSNTTENSNPVLGLLAENACAKVIQSTPGVRGQTWALVEPVACSQQ